jgi:RNA polymerase sigma-70 factor (ECF subfamily)
VAHGDDHRQPFADLLDAHGAAVLAMLRRLCGNRHDADDAFQETAARVWRHLASRAWYQPRPWLRNPRAWVMTVAYRAFVDARVRRRPHEELREPADGRVEPPDRSAERAETADRVQAAIAALSGPTREVVVLHYLGGLTIGQVAAAMDLAEGTVKSRLNAALTKLRDALVADGTG